MADRQADPAALGVGVEMRRAFAGQVREEEEALGPGAGERGLVGEQEVRVDALLLAPADLGLAQLVAEPLEAARRPRARRPSRARPPAPRGSRAGAGPGGRSRARSAWAKTTPEVPIVAETTPWPDDPVAHRAGGLVAAAADDRRPLRQRRSPPHPVSLTLAETSGLS